MPDNSEDLAARINLTGWWFAKFDEPAARLCVEELRKRCPATALARQAEASGWVVPIATGVEERLTMLQ